MSRAVTLRRAGQRDREFIEILLRDNDLPVEDIDDVLDCLYVCEAGGERLGVGGLERYGDVALLRSVVIEESAREQGYGTAVCEAILDSAGADGIADVYLLTSTAPGFFRRLGFEEIDRETVPEPIQGTTEFSDLCPATAVCMQCELDATKDERRE
jgi:amino-acid N-acetyltransferase